MQRQSEHLNIPNSDIFSHPVSNNNWRSFLCVEKVTSIHGTPRLPLRGSANAAGYDLFPYADGIIPPWGKVVVGTGLKIIMPNGVYGRIASRSGMSRHNDIEVGAGVIDADYRGEIEVILRNFSDTQYNYTKNKAIAQLILTPYVAVNVKEIKALSDIDRPSNATSRGCAGFGSTDVKQ